jgi:tetratricopeptide (TPR) repeat protein
MRLFQPQILPVVLCLLLAALPAFAEEILTNRSVGRMVAAGLSPDIITAKIQGTKNSFDVSIDAILQLKKDGVHDEIIKAMVEAASSHEPPAAADHDQADRYYEPGSRYEPRPRYDAEPSRYERKEDQVARLLIDINEAMTLKEQGDYSWKTKVNPISATLKSIYPANTHNINYWWAYTQFSVLVEKEHHILKGLKKVLYFDANHEDALILKGDTCLVQAKRLRPGDDTATYSREEMGTEAADAYKAALNLPRLPAAKKSKIHYRLGEIAREIDQSKTRAERHWQQAMEEDPQGQWAILAANRLGIPLDQGSPAPYPPAETASPLPEEDSQPLQGLP